MKEGKMEDDMWGFSNSNLGGFIIGLPIDGGDAGPIRVIPISHVFSRNFLRKLCQIDWESLFPNKEGKK